jgi:hypothetical protein
VIIVGFVLFAAAVVLAVALIVQNAATVTVHVFNQYGDVEMRWLFVAGLAVTAIGLLGVGMMRLVVARVERLRGERWALAVENKRLAQRAAAAAPMGLQRDTAAPREPYPVETAQPASKRHSLRERLVATRRRERRAPNPLPIRRRYDGGVALGDVGDVPEADPVMGSTYGFSAPAGYRFPVR